MKTKLLILVIAIMSICNLLSQNSEPEQLKFIVPAINPTTPIYLSGDLPYFQLDRFIKGWHWDTHPRIGKILNANQMDIYSNYKLDSIPLNPNTLLFVKMYNNSMFYTHCANADLLNTRGIHFEPTLQIDKSKTHTVQTIIGDSTNPIFGFEKIRGIITTNPNSPLFGRLLINNDSLKDSVILEKPWRADALFFDDNKDSLDFEKERDYLCRGMYISINLRRESLDSTLNDDPVLKIELPYTYIDSVINYGERLVFKEGANPLYFDFLPNNYGVNTDTLSDGSKVLGVHEVTTRPTYFYITKNMLPLGKESITVSAFVYLDKIKRHFTDKNNFYLKKSLTDSGAIHELKVKVTYMGNLPISIDWIRYETPATKKLHSGFLDNDISAQVSYALNKFATTEHLEQGIKLFRFNTHIEGSTQQWIGERYLRKLIGDVMTGETGPEYTHLYEHYVNTADRWLSNSSIPTSVSVPFYECYGNPINNYNFYFGYKGFYDTTSIPQIFNSKYEIELRSQSTPIQTKSMTLNDYLKFENCIYSGGKFSSLSLCEHLTYTNYVKDYTNNFLYSDKNWYSQSFILSKLIFNNNDSAHFHLDHRNPTGEEFKLYNFKPILMGAKGVIYDGAAESFVYQDPDSLDKMVDHYIRLFLNEGNIKEIYQTNNLDTIEPV